jgi:nucleotide-binding universal stress UspA family protein
MFRNILVCVDGSAHAERALTEAIDLADAERSRLTILTAIARPPYWACTPTTAVGIGSLAGDLAAEAAAALRAAVDRVPPSIPVTTILTEEPIREALIDRVETGEHDLVVMGSRGRGALSASFLGSVSHYALNHCPVPVLIVHAEVDSAPTGPTPADAAASPPDAEPARAAAVPADADAAEPAPEAMAAV